MKKFTELFAQLDQAIEPEVKIAALADYFARADKRDCLWTIAILSNRRPKRALTTARLGERAVDLGEIPLWLFDASYQASGDLAETYAQYDRRTNLITDFTFALWGDDQLLTFTKASSGLTDEEYREITDWASKNTLEFFGPVRSLRPIHVLRLPLKVLAAGVGINWLRRRIHWRICINC